MPRKLDATVIKSSVNSSAAHTISFLNPLKLSTKLCLSLTGKDSSHFHLLTRQSNTSVIVHEGKSIVIGLVFSPEEMHQHEVVFSISTDVNCTCDSCEEPDCAVQHQMCWEYPIIGQPLVHLTPARSAPKIKCRAKKPIGNIVLVVRLRKSSQASNARLVRNEGRSSISIFLIFLIISTEVCHVSIVEASS